MKVLIACEESGTVRDAFLRKGHDAWSCDLLPTRSNPERHFQRDVLYVAYNFTWDLMIAHPPCTEFSSSGARWRSDHWVERKEGGYWHDGARKRQLQKEAFEFVQCLWSAPIARKALENPVGELSSLWRKPDQIIHPYQFGHPEFKRTGLWLENLPLLKPTCILNPPAKNNKRAHEEWSIVHRAQKGPNRARDRAVTYSGWAEAMAVQWGMV